MSLEPGADQLEPSGGMPSTDEGSAEGTIEAYILLPIERVLCTLILLEEDEDVHLVISQPGEPASTMIVEFPECVAAPLKRAKIAAARQLFTHNCGPVTASSWTKLDGSVTITGVGFWDSNHGQAGVAPNAIELHPVLNFQGDCHPASTGGGGGGGGGNPPPTNCTPGYSPCLIYHGGADYDCSGGSGNGPYYTAPGVTYRVTGSDPYGLDSDGDGYGCE
jgi:hypothetical protein